MTKTNRISIIAAAAVMLASCGTSKEVTYNWDKMAKPTETVYLYPEGQKVDKGIIEDGVTVTLGPGMDNEYREGETVTERGNCKGTGDEARMIFYIPKKCNGQMVIICPGGGYSNTSARNEGTKVAQWLCERGIAACNLIYRMPYKTHPIVPLTDVQNAFRYCRFHAEEWGVSQIGVMGFSAGGHLAASASTLYSDAVTRPDFSILVYPVITMEDGVTHQGTKNNLTNDGKDKNLVEHFSLENRVNAQTPPTMLILSGDDGAVPPENSIRYFKKLRENGVQGEMYILPFGGHGWGFRTDDNEKLTDGTRSLFFHALDNFLYRMSLNK